MSVMRFILGFSLLLFPLMGALAEGSHDFFRDQSPRDIFSVRVSEPLDSGIYLLRDRDLVEVEPELEELLEQAKPLPEHEQASIPTTREEIVSRFGSPEGDEPVKAIEDAPRPFKGMMAAINAGDERLAWEYARKYTRYVRDVQAATGKAVGLQAKAMEIEGLVDGEGWTGAERFKRYDKYLYEDLKIEDRSNIENRGHGSLLLHLSEQLQSKITTRGHFRNPESQDLLENEQALRQQIRSRLSRFIPGSSDAKIEVLFFVAPQQSDSVLMGREMERVYNFTKGHDRINFVAVSNSDLNPSNIKRFKYSTGASYSVMPYLAFAEVIDLPESAPALVLMSSASREIFVEHGMRRAFFVEELISMMVGGARE